MAKKRKGGKKGKKKKKKVPHPPAEPAKIPSRRAVLFGWLRPVGRAARVAAKEVAKPAISLKHPFRMPRESRRHFLVRLSASGALLALGTGLRKKIAKVIVKAIVPETIQERFATLLLVKHGKEPFNYIKSIADHIRQAKKAGKPYTLIAFESSQLSHQQVHEYDTAQVEWAEDTRRGMKEKGIKLEFNEATYNYVKNQRLTADEEFQKHVWFIALEQNIPIRAAESYSKKEMEMLKGLRKKAGQHLENCITETNVMENAFREIKAWTQTIFQTYNFRSKRMAKTLNFLAGTHEKPRILLLGGVAHKPVLNEIRKIAPKMKVDVFEPKIVGQDTVTKIFSKPEKSGSDHAKIAIQFLLDRAKPALFTERQKKELERAQAKAERITFAEWKKLEQETKDLRLNEALAYLIIHFSK